MNNDTFVPDMEDMGGITPSLWRYTPILPLVFGMELSYMEQVAKLTHKINEIINSDNAQANNIQKLYQAFAELEAAALGKGKGWITTAMLADSSVTTEKLANGAVITSKLADVAVTAEKLALMCVATKHLQDKAVTGDKLAENSIDGTHIKPHSLGSDVLGEGCIENHHLAVGAVHTSHITPGAVDELSIKDGAISAKKISPGCITNDHLGEQCVEGDNIAVGAVRASHISNGQIYESALNEEVKGLIGRGYYNAKLYGAVGNGADNDAPALNALVTAVANRGGGTIYLPRGVYMLDEPILWQSNVSLVGEGIGIAVLKPRQVVGGNEGFAAIRGLTFTANNPCTNCTFERFTIDGSEMAISHYTSWPKGINIHYMKDCVVRDIVIQNTCATGLGIDFLDGVTIESVNCHNCGREAFVDGVEINEGGAGIGIGTMGMASENFTIQNCTVSNSGRYGILIERQHSGTDGSETNIIIANNIVRNGRQHGITIKGGSRIIIEGNIVYENEGGGLTISENNGYATSVVKLVENVVYNNNTGFVVNCNGATEDIFFTGNTVSDCTTGVAIKNDVANLQLSRNVIKDCDNPIVLNAVTIRNFMYRENSILDCTNGVASSASFTGETKYIEELTSAPASKIEMTTEGFAKDIKLMPDGSEAAQSEAMTSGFVDVRGIEGNIRIATTGHTDSLRVCQYDADKVSLSTNATQHTISGYDTQVLTIERVDGCAFIRLCYSAVIIDGNRAYAPIQSIVIECADD